MICHRICCIESIKGKIMVWCAFEVYTINSIISSIWKEDEWKYKLKYLSDETGVIKTSLYPGESWENIKKSQKDKHLIIL
jgi:hypothetical protein